MKWKKKIKFIGGCKSLFNFEKSIKEVISIYNNSSVYHERNISINRSL